MKIDRVQLAGQPVVNGILSNKHRAVALVAGVGAGIFDACKEQGYIFNIADIFIVYDRMKVVKLKTACKVVGIGQADKQKYCDANLFQISTICCKASDPTHIIFFSSSILLPLSSMLSSSGI